MLNFLKEFLGSVPTVQADDVKQAMDSGKKCIILDVRTTEEYERGHLEKAVHLPVDQVEEKITKVIPDISSLVYVYCLSGSRSIYAVDIMKKKGYTNTFDMSHGLLAWRVKRYPVVT